MSKLIRGIKIETSESVRRKLIKIVINDMRLLDKQLEDLTSQDKLFDDNIDANKIKDIQTQRGYLYNLMTYLKKFNKKRTYLEGVQPIRYKPDSTDIDPDMAEMFGIISRQEYNIENMSEWDKKFIDDIRVRVLMYGNKTYISDKQRNIIVRILNKAKEI